MKKTILLFAAWLFMANHLSAQECQPVNDCEMAVLICGYAMEHNVFNNSVAPVNAPDICNIKRHNTVWFQVIPCDPVLELAINTSSWTTGDGLQVALLESCDATNAVACNPGQAMGAGIPLTLLANVTPGQSYWLMVDGFINDTCDFTFDIIQGIDTKFPTPSSGGPFPGTITGQSFGICQTSAGVYTATWPGCTNWTGGGFVCKDDDCTCVNWTLPPGAVIIGDPCSPSVTIDFSGTPPGGYLLVATPECLCDENLCESCGPICCPVTPAQLPISINGVPTINLPDIWVCTFDDMPNCIFEPGGSFNSTTGVCVTLDLPNCQFVRQTYRVRSPIVENLGNLPLCDTIWVCDVPYTTPGQYIEFCITPDGCDSTILFNVVPDPSCIFHCTGLNIPAAPGDSCHLAPFFCGSHLESYCGSNVGLQDDSIGNIVLDNAGFIRFSTCEDSVSFRVAVNNCTPGSTGLNFEISTGTCLSGNSLATTTVNNLEFFTWEVEGFNPDSVYTLVVSGVNGSECDFTIQALFGIGTGQPPVDSCVCTDGYIDGPDQICPGEVYQFSVVWPTCTVVPGTSTGGNGDFCLPAGICPGSGADSLVFKWHIPAGTVFVGDSTGSSIFIALDSSFFDLDTMIMDSVWIEWAFISTDTTTVDSLLFCGCSGAACVGQIKAKEVLIFHNIDYYSCTLTCVQPSCEIDGIVYSAPGNYVRDVDNCNRQIIEVLADFNSPNPPLVNGQTICLGESATLTVLNSFPPYFYNWSSGDFGETITVSPTTTTTYTIFVTDLDNGCVSFGQVTVAVLPQVPPTNLGPQIICPGQSVTVCGNVYDSPGNYTEVCTSWLGCDSIINFSIVLSPGPGFIVNATNNPACLGETVLLNAVLLNPNPGTTITWTNLSTFEAFTGPSISVTPASTTTFQIVSIDGSFGCTNTQNFQVTVNQPSQQQLGIVGQVSCNEPCVVFNGENYCAPGIYNDTANCIISIFEIGFRKDTVQDGVVGLLTCLNPCLDHLGQTICAAGVYTAEDSCFIHVFEVLQDQIQPLLTLQADAMTICIGENVNLSAQSDGQGYQFQWQDLTTGMTYSEETIQVTPATTTTFEASVTNPVNGCSWSEQITITVNPLAEQQLGVVGRVSCNEPCLDFNGQNYCEPGIYNDTANCIISIFEIGFRKDTVQDGPIGTLTCQDTCLTYLGQSFCVPGTYTVEDSCFVHQFEVGENMLVPTVSDLVHTCLPNNTQFTVSFNMAGLPPFKVNDIPIATSNYLSQPLQNNTNYLYVVKQANGCETSIIGSYDCAASCVSDAGQLSGELILACAGQSEIQVQSLADPVSASGDLVVFWLISADGTVLEQSTTGSFAFNPATLAFGQTYQVVRAVGPADMNGMPDTNHPCTVISSAQPIVFQSVPQIDSIATGSPKCAGEATGWLEIIGSDAASGDLEYAIDGQAFGPVAFLDNLEAGVYEVEVKNNAGCSSRTSITIPDAIDIELEIGPDQTINFGESVTITATTSKPPASIAWSASNGWTESDSIEWLIRPVENIIVYCEVIDSNGCKDNDEALILVKLETNIYRPNVINPNSLEGANRYFTLFAAEGWISSIVQMSVFNRWGEMVWQKDNFNANIPEAGWDGMHKGRFCLPGVYIYRAEVELADGSKAVFEGNVTLVR